MRIRTKKSPIINAIKVLLSIVLFLLISGCDDSDKTTRAFVTIWKTDNSGFTNDNQIKIGTSGSGYNYHIEWGDGLVDDNVKGDITHSYQTAGIYTIRINGDFPQIYFSFPGYDNEKLLSIEEWGDTQRYSMNQASDCCINFVDNTTDILDLPETADMEKTPTASIGNNETMDDVDVSPVVLHGKVFLNEETFKESFQEVIQLRKNNQIEQASGLLSRILVSKNLTALQRSSAFLQQGHIFREIRMLEKARVAYGKSIEFNSEQTNAMLHLSDLYGNGFGDVEQDIDKMWFYLNLAEQKGDIEALIQKGQRYRDGVHTKVDAEKAFNLFNRAMEAGSSDAMVLISCFYRDGEVVFQNKERAIDLLLSAHNLGNIAAIGALGNAYYFGEIVEKDLEKAFDYYVEAAEKGHVSSMSALGVFYDNGIYIEVDLEKAHYWFTRAANSGDAIAMVFLAQLYEEERGVEQDFEKAFDLYFKATKAGDSEGMAHLGRMYLEGVAVGKNLEKALELLEKSAGLGNSRGQCFLGLAYSNGDVVERDIDKAIIFFEKGAAQHDVKCLMSLGGLYEDGTGVPKDLKKAEEYYLAAFELGEYSAQLQLANWYRDGIYYEKNHEKSKSLYEKALKTKYTAVYDEYAMLLATSSQDNIRDGRKAVEYAEKASAIRFQKSYLEALAAAYAANNRFSDAVRVQSEFLEYLNEINQAKRIVEIQKGYLNDYQNFRARYD